MENKFIINNDERQRILSLHENSTKHQYLNVISEQLSKTMDSYTLLSSVELENNTGGNERDLILQKGAVFTKSNKDGYLESKTTYSLPQNMTSNASKEDYKTGTVYYNCKTFKFSIPGQTYSWYEDTSYSKAQGNKTLTGSLSKVCNTKKGESNSQSNKQTDKKTYSTAKSHTFGGGKVTLPVGTNFIQAKDGASAKVNGVWGFYSCKNQSYFVTGSNVGVKEDDKTQSLGKKLNQEFCKGSSIDTGFKQQKLGGSLKGNTDAIVIPTDIDLSQITKELPAELQAVLTPPTVDGQPNTGGQPDFNQLLTQLQGLS